MSVGTEQVSWNVVKNITETQTNTTGSVPKTKRDKSHNYINQIHNTTASSVQPDLNQITYMLNVKSDSLYTNIKSDSLHTSIKSDSLRTSIKRSSV